MWQRIAAFLSFVALASALLAPSALLAQEVRTGKLGGLCGTSSATTGVQADGDGASAQTHCDACGSSQTALTFSCGAGAASASSHVVANGFFPVDVSARLKGPVSIRGPPAA